MRLKRNLAADAALVATTVVWGSTFVTASDVLEHWPPGAYIAFRFALAALLLAALFPGQIWRARAGDWKAGATLGLLMIVGFTLQAAGQVYTTPAKSAFITGLTTPLVPFISFLWLRLRPGLENLLGVALASVGGILILAPSSASGLNRGDLLTLASTVLFATHLTVLSVYARRTNVRRLTVLQVATAGAVALMGWAAVRLCASWWPGGVLTEVLRQEAMPIPWSARVVVQIVYLAAIATVATFLLWTWGQARMSATHAAIIFSLEPVFAILFAVMMRGSSQWLSRQGTLGAGLILSGVIVADLRLTNRRAARDDTQYDEEDAGGEAASAVTYRIS